MRPVLLTTALLLASGSLAAQTAPDTQAAASAVANEVLVWRRDIHQHPELGNRETRTSKLVADHLRKLAMDVRTGIGGTGVVGILRGGKPGPRIALRADMDALPVTERGDLPFASKVTTQYRGQTTGVMHACGHDTHTAVLMGVAKALAGMRKDLPGEVMFVFQPAEEGAPEGEQGGASRMLAEGLFADFKPEAMFGLHVIAGIPSDTIAVRPGPFMAGSDRFTITVLGRQTHGAKPWGGIDPIVTAAQIVSSAQTLVSRRAELTRAPLVLSFGAINGGIRYNIIPDNVQLEGTIRTFKPDMRDDVLAGLRNLAEHIAAANGATVQLQIPAEEGNPVVVNDPALTARAHGSLLRAAGAGKVIEIDPITGAEDFAYYANQVPAVFFFVGATPPERDMKTVASNHSPDFFVDEAALPLATRAMLQVAIDYLYGVK
ncbi:MAG: N-acyl-L-amino acid amidohydrolase [Lysobacterales bacterium CG17_big_fil_post_rev_8_21_14_2_50_64_11]|nr:MAG: N-acyl-L-amino acid amidohydrolase [Xanthomonadales bacterium CG17_big_fil_post_rev_8_21_14_2_50_64_11]